MLAFTARGAEELLLSLLQDVRLLQRVASMYEQLQKHLRDMALISPFVWSRFEQLMGGASDDFSLRHEVLKGSATSFAYIDREMFSCVRSGVLAMTQGDIGAHVDALAAGNLPPSDPPMPIAGLMAATTPTEITPAPHSPPHNLNTSAR